MTFNQDIEHFIQQYVKDLKEGNAIVFAGAGLSVEQGFLDWKTLLTPIAERLELDIQDEHDLSALAQYFVDTIGSRGDINQILVDRYSDQDIKISVKHKILARLPIQTYWTTNYDSLIEDALKDAGKTADVKRSQDNLFTNKPKRDAIVYKMHGDISLPHDTVLTKHEYEDYNSKRELFSNAFKNDFVSKTFLFIGFSFTDPNLDYLISRIRSIARLNVKPDYYFIKKKADTKKNKSQEVRANSLRKYGLNPIWVDDYAEIEVILKEVETRYLRSSILISGSADKYDPYTKEDAETFLHNLSKSLSHARYKIVTGFGLGVGSAVINGVLDNMDSKHNKNLDNYIIMRPFPQIFPKGTDQQERWKEYRYGFIPLAGIAVFVFGNKKDTELAEGVEKEFDIAVENGLKVIPIGATGYMSEKLWKKVYQDLDTYYPNQINIKPLFEKLGDKSVPLTELIEITIQIINILN